MIPSRKTLEAWQGLAVVPPAFMAIAQDMLTEIENLRVSYDCWQAKTEEVARLRSEVSNVNMQNDLLVAELTKAKRETERLRGTIASLRGGAL